MGFLKTLFGGSSSNSTPKSNTNKSIGHAVFDKYRPFITDKESAKKAALSVLWHGKTQFVDGPDGTVIRASDSAIPLPPRLQAFSDRFYDEEGMTASNEVVDLTYQLTRTIDDQYIQIETIYSIAEAIVERYNL
ncbi:hypothetical protein [Sphingomonas sp. LH128]|uniref:hypothetical protein n=1 Tax=Sphingomonas sp. LH128 TaxID=473781 RepID=UPI00155E968F|nr:hypothetical protein [Sphingomonas sp. LH128]